MPAKRRAAKIRTRTIPHEMRPMAERLMVLKEAHRAAISGGDQSFYSDGRHEELCNLLPIINEALGIRPWQDSDTIIREALAAS